ncbi:hypothetical protein ACWHLZ_35130 [Streptomyces chartreusis]|uniref:hypothetical protein n=1 Tax=Streptomyces TaxID=1883 RepID=UPI002E808F48|nr:hypothetical protein [Streptomyces chartreusis]WSZ68263.1 hypothetical protein OG938_21355 [Streptomyces chartreusis]WTA28863.1 hypothetical protein OIA45_23870 [Streptomyces chartreusis]WUB19362.1 hypothetical protein OG997_22800 [Streptomyces chartreusis]
MAHAAPAPGARTPAALTPLPDVFSARTHRIAGIVTPVVLGLIYGYWAAANRRSGGEITGWNLLFGFVTAAVFMILYVGVRALAPHMRRELHAIVWAAFVGAAFGFLYSEAGAAIIRSCVMGAVIGAVTFVVMFYRYYTHEDAVGHRIR